MTDFKDFEQFYSYISTHTLTWSVTWFNTCTWIFWQHFNSHAHVERDWFNTCTWIFWQHFNSHAHVERDLAKLLCSATRFSFQLTRSRGAWRLADWLKYENVIISTHTLTWSVTDIAKIFEEIELFQLTRSRGAWRGFATGTNYQEAFQLTRSRGAWLSL